MSRELYDACRTYKHFYRKHEDVKSWNEKYYDIDLSDAINKTGGQLREATHNLQGKLFKEFDVRCINIESSVETEPLFSDSDRFGRCFNPYRSNHSDAVFAESREFLYCLANYMQDWRMR